jgi:hypothetical protein
MDERIEVLFSTLQLPKEHWPPYTDPYSFGQSIQKCSLTTNVLTTTSGSTYQVSDKGTTERQG